MSTEHGRYSKVSRRMWNDERFRKLSPPQPNAQTLWQRLLTGPELTNIPGCFQAWDAGLARALGWELKAFLKAFEEVTDQQMAFADWATGFVWVPKAILHNRPESPNVVKSWRSSWDLLPECQLKAQAYWALRSYVEGLGEAYLEAFLQGCSEPSTKAVAHPSPNQEQEQEQEQERADVELARPAPKANDREQVRKVFEFWQREHNHPRAKLDKTRTACIRARLREGFTVHDLCSAIRGAKRDDFLMGRDPKANGVVYDELVSLLRNGPKVEKLMALIGKKRGSQPGVDPAEAERREAEYQARIQAEAAAHHAKAKAELEAQGALPLQANGQPDLKAIAGGIGG